MSTAPIEIVTPRKHPVPDRVLRTLAKRLATALTTSVSVTGPIDVGPAADEAEVGPQLSSNRIIDHLIARDGARDHPPRRWVVAVTNADLAAPERDFVFGEATVGGAWAVVSTARLQEDDDEDATLDRLMKETVHELGHIAGLDHCPRPKCVMHPSTSVLEIDRKQAAFCDRCNSRFPPASRT
ncbi:MAG: matrixin family metalloprotease [Gemmatimonadota bacterium]